MGLRQDIKRPICKLLENTQDLKGILCMGFPPYVNDTVCGGFMLVYSYPKPWEDLNLR